MDLIRLGTIINHPWLGMVNIPHVFLVMTGGWFIIVLAILMAVWPSTNGDLLVIYNGFQKTGVLYIYIYIWDQTVTGPEDCRFWSFLVLKHPMFMASLILTHIHTKQLKYHSRLLVGRVYKGLPQLILFLDYSNSWATYHPTSIMGWDGDIFRGSSWDGIGKRCNVGWMGSHPWKNWSLLNQTYKAATIKSMGECSLLGAKRAI